MATKMKRLMALLLVLVLVTSQLATPVLATEGSAVADSTPAGDTGTSGASASAAAPVVTQTVDTSTDASTGAQTTVTTTTTEAPGSVTTNVTTETSNTSPDGTQSTSSTQWSTTTTETGSSTTGTNPVTQVDTNKVTQVDGNETTESNISHDSATGVETVSGQLSGQEETTIDGTTTTTTTETGKVLDSETVTEADVDTDQGTDTQETDNAFIPGQETVGEWTAGEPVKKGTSDSTNATKEETITPDPDQEVTLDMTPGGGWVEKTVEIKWDEIIDMKDEDIVSKTPKYENGEIVGYTIVYKSYNHTSTPYSAGTKTETGEWTDSGKAVQTYIDPGTYSEGSNTTGQNLSEVANGESTTTTTEKIQDEDGNFLGYRIITVTTTKATSDTVDKDVGTHTDAAYQKTVGDVLNNGYTMPEKPEESTSTNANGETTTTTVTLIEEQGQPKGYTILTEIRSADGKLMYTETKNIYGTASTIQTTVETDPTSERTTTTTLTTKTTIQDIYTTETTQAKTRTDTKTVTNEIRYLTDLDEYKLVETDNGLAFLYQGKMYKVQAISTHGDTTISTLTPDKDLITASEGSDLRNKNNTSTGLFSGYGNKDNDSFSGDYEYRYVGNGVASTLQVNYKNGGYTSAHQFALRDSSGNLHYVYCCDLDTSAVKGTYYEIENLKDAGYYNTSKGSDAIDHIRTIATNGFWGTEGGEDDTGTLDAVKALLIDYDQYFDADLTAVANSLTEGEALTATQAALWAFGNKDGTVPSETDMVHYLKTNGYYSNSTDERNVKALYNLLISDRLKNNTADTATDLLDTTDITGSSITIHNEVIDTATGEAKTQNGHKVYNTDVTFELSVKQSDLTGNMVIVLTQDGVEKGKINLASDKSNWMGKIIADGTTGSAIVFENVELAEGIKVNLSITGTQKMEEGVYLYTAKGGADASQTFVGVASGTRDVNLSVNMEFKVEDPVIKKTEKLQQSYYREVTTSTRTATRTDTKQDTKTVTGNTQKVQTSHAVDIIGTETTTVTKKDITKEDRHWEAYWKYLLTTVWDEDGGGGGGNRRTTIEDEEVPLAAAPETGDISGLWAAISLISLSGAIWLGKRKDEE